uniref:APCDDC domain-containing protein n=1 Tax=Macrostomum lignano TaxID=282301 RepID=A0A1I8IVC6_9PLAT
CEIRPGPEFVTRRYQFINDTHFSALQFYYSDSSCRDAFYGLETRGYLKVTAMPYTESAARFLQSKVTSVSAECRRRFQSNPLESDWSPGGGPYHLLLYVEYRGRVMRDFDCSRKLGFNLHEMQLVRTELGAERRRRLYLGDLATDFSQRHRHRPSSFQEPLEEATQAPDCSNCQLLSRASLRQPPALPWRALMTLSGSPLGEWISVRCESRPQSNYLIRRLRFLPASNSSASSSRWVGEYHHFHDPLCGRPYFSVTAYGWVTAKSRDSLLPATRQFEFRIVGLAITPRDSRSLDQLTAYDGFGCGRRSDWRLNQAQDVTSTNGCDHFRLSGGGGGIDSRGVPERHLPTSFQSPLIRCREFETRASFASSASSASAVPHQPPSASSKEDARSEGRSSGGSPLAQQRHRVSCWVLAAAMALNSPWY